MLQVEKEGIISLDAQVRAYDLLEIMLESGEHGCAGCTNDFCSVYSRLKPVLDKAYDHQTLVRQNEDRLRPFRERLQEAESASAKAVALHECAKDTYVIWQNKGLISRYRALARLRSLAGFRLESHRLGNYVAKTFDLMNEAAADFARAQQSMFAADMSYKIKPGIYQSIYEILIDNTSL